MFLILIFTLSFTDTNPLQTARKIVEGEIEPIPDPDELYTEEIKCLIMLMLNPDTDKRPDIIEVMQMMGSWDRDDRMTARDALERTDELYMRTHQLQERIQGLEMEKDRLDSVVRTTRETSTRGGLMGSIAPYFAGMGIATPNRAGGFASPIRGRRMEISTPITPHTPGGNFFPMTPATPSHVGRHFPQTPVNKATRAGLGTSLRVPAAHVKEIDPASQVLSAAACLLPWLLTRVLGRNTWQMLNQLHKIVFVTQLPPDMRDGQVFLPFLLLNSCREITLAQQP